jgi:hypothetical protein
MYSAAKELLKREAVQARQTETLNVNELQKAKTSLDATVQELQEYVNLPTDRTFLIKSDYVSGLAKAVSQTAQTYAILLEATLLRLEKAKNSNEETLKDATFELIKASEQATSDVSEMKEAIFQILKILTRNADAELKMIDEIRLELKQW